MKSRETHESQCVRSLGALFAPRLNISFSTLLHFSSKIEVLKMKSQGRLYVRHCKYYCSVCLKVWGMKCTIALLLKQLDSVYEECRPDELCSGMLWSCSEE